MAPKTCGFLEARKLRIYFHFIAKAARAHSSQDMSLKVVQLSLSKTKTLDGFEIKTSLMESDRIDRRVKIPHCLSMNFSSSLSAFPLEADGSTVSRCPTDGLEGS